MDDVDAVQAQIARNMLDSGDWVTARLDGVAYLEKSPLKYWMIAVSLHDLRRARLGRAHSASRCRPSLLCWLTARFGRWAFGDGPASTPGLALATCVGLFLFTRILIPDVILTLDHHARPCGRFLRALDEDEPHPRALGAAAVRPASARDCC